jgi:hypothetical protein
LFHAATIKNWVIEREVSLNREEIGRERESFCLSQLFIKLYNVSRAIKENVTAPIQQQLQIRSNLYQKHRNNLKILKTRRKIKKISLCLFYESGKFELG